MRASTFLSILARPCLAVVLLSPVLLPTAGCTGDPDSAAPPELIQSNQAGEAPAAEQAAAAEEAQQDEKDEAATEAPAEREPFTAERLEQLVAPVALYPDALLMEILMAATYPAEVAEAAAWRKENPDLMGKELDEAIAAKGWDVSVNSLVHATKALELMAADPEWTRDLGDAFLAQQDDVLNAVQVMRTKACDLGNLKTTAEQEVIIEDAPAEPAPVQQQAPLVVQAPPRIVRILPVQPQVIYVPVYNPRVIYGPPPPVIFYPRVMLYPSFQVGVAPVISFGIGLTIGNFLWGDVDWRYRNVYARPYGGGYRGGYRPDYYRDANPWRHNSHHRRGIDYRDRYVARSYGYPDPRPGKRPDHSYYPPGRDKDRGRDERRGDYGDRRGDDRRGDYSDRRGDSGERSGRPGDDRYSTRDGDRSSKPALDKPGKPSTDKSGKPTGGSTARPPKSGERDDRGRGGPAPKSPGMAKPSTKQSPGKAPSPPKGGSMGKPSDKSSSRGGGQPPRAGSGGNRGGGSSKAHGSSKGGSSMKSGGSSKGGGSSRPGGAPKGGGSSKGGSSKGGGKDEKGGSSKGGGGGSKGGR